VFPFSLSDSLAGLLRDRSHPLQPVALTRLIRRALTIRRIEEAVLPLHIVTTDLLSGAEVILSSGDAEQAMVYIREAHPGELLPAHESMMQKRAQAERLRQAEGIDWPMLIDDTDGTTHKAYDEMPNPVFVIDRDGYVAFRGEFAHAPTLWQALQALQAQDWRGMAPHSLDKKPHMLGATAFGWRGPERGGEIAQHDLMKGAPPLALNLRLGQWMEPVLGPLQAAASRFLPARNWRWLPEGWGC
ncbi:hypothetical protein NA637_19060, partial [Pseudomonas stutzeri]|nr:hypothetical protein [Stutzerimonas stutzeri]